MDSAGSHSERFVEQRVSEDDLSQIPDMQLGITTPMSPLASPPSGPLSAAEEVAQTVPAEGGSVSVFRVDQERLTALQDLTWRRVRLLLWALVVGVGLGLLLLIPAVHATLPPAPVVHLPKGAPAPVTHPGSIQRPFWAALLFVLGVGAPVLALGLGVLALPVLLWRAAWLRRQQALHLAIGRQGLLFFLPGQLGHWYLLPWGHITSLTDVSVVARNGRRERLRTVLWRRWARLQRAYRRGRHLDKTSARKQVRSPFRLHVQAAGPQQRLRVVCYARLPDSGYGWLFTLAPFTRRVSATTFLVDTGWFESATGLHGVSLHRALLALWDSSPARAQRAPVPLPSARGAVLLNAAGSAQQPEARRVDGPVWAALPLVPALSVATVIIALVMRQPLASGALLNLATLCVLAVGLGLLLAGVRWPTKARLFTGGAFVLALAGVVNVVYAVAALLQDWRWSFRLAPGQPFFLLEALAGLLLVLGGVALGLEGSGRPGVRAAASQSEALNERLHSTELVVALGLLVLAVARMLEDIDLAALNNNAAALPWLRNTLAEPLLPLAIIGLSYCVLLAGAPLQSLFRMLQVIYGLVLAFLVPLAFLFVARATSSAKPLPKEWLPLLALELICGLLVAFWSLRARRREQRGL
jgi:hypothetical protein